MQSPRSRALIGVGALVVVVALFFILRGGDDDETTTTAAPTTTTTTAAETTTDSGGQGGGDTTAEDGGQTKPDEGDEITTIVVKGGQPVGGVQELTFTEGDDIRFKVESDVAEEIHMHGYDVAEEIEAGGSVEFDVPASITGVFEVELEHSVVPIAEITVNPA